MQNGFVINGATLYNLAREHGKISSLNAAVSAIPDITYPTALGFKNTSPTRPQNPTLDKLYTFIVDVLGYTPDELARLSFLDVLNMVQDGEVYGGNPQNMDRILKLTAAQRVVDELYDLEDETPQPTES